MNSTSQKPSETGLIVAVVPARGGSKGIPLKNLREIGSKPLIQYTIEAALNAITIDKVIVSTDSDEIAEVARRVGAEVPFMRPGNLADDKTPLAAVMQHFLDWSDEKGWKIKALVILEPTSPLRTNKEIDEAVQLFSESNADTVVSVQEDRSIGWEIDDEDRVIPLNPERVNRQLLRPRFKENGAIFVTRPSSVTNETTIGEKVKLYAMGEKKSLDINTFWDLQLSNLLLRSVGIIFHFKATAELGFGHYYRALALANRLYHNDVILLCSEFDDGLEQKISRGGFKYYLSEDPLKIIKEEKPSIVVNDILDTSEEFMRELSDVGPLIVNFEDLGVGREYADLVFNALYDDFSIDPQHFGGAAYAVMREEFMFLPRHIIREEVQVVTATFGGSDPNNIALHCMKTLPEKFPKINFRIIVGPGYKHIKSTIRKLAEKLPNAILIDTATDMVKHLSEADIVITSGGRTVFETAACGTPCVVICQNQRELTHRHITSKDGVISLGLFDDKESMPRLMNAVETLSKNHSQRALMSEKSSSLVDGLGIFRIIGLMERATRAKRIAKIL
ncbi:MAG: cytidylyltransferase domain-containing protein [Candidatus Thorarchaeota archaeon]|jgi:CMP-N-acetylneuraminic acid synthetase/UDP-N-acetylglucosamine:LPS N-acetylglucosamine transferase